MNDPATKIKIADARRNAKLSLVIGVTFTFVFFVIQDIFSRTGVVRPNDKAYVAWYDIVMLLTSILAIVSFFAAILGCVGYLNTVGMELRRRDAANNRQSQLS